MRVWVCVVREVTVAAWRVVSEWRVVWRAFVDCWENFLWLSVRMAA